MFFRAQRRAETPQLRPGDTESDTQSAALPVNRRSPASWPLTGAVGGPAALGGARLEAAGGRPARLGRASSPLPAPPPTRCPPAGVAEPIRRGRAGPPLPTFSSSDTRSSKSAILAALSRARARAEHAGSVAGLDRKRQRCHVGCGQTLRGGHGRSGRARWEGEGSADGAAAAGAAQEPPRLLSRGVVGRWGRAPLVAER